MSVLTSCLIFFFNDTATTEIYTLSLHDALPISGADGRHQRGTEDQGRGCWGRTRRSRSEEHTSELQSHLNLVCRLLLEKKKTKYRKNATPCPVRRRASCTDHRCF